MDAIQEYKKLFYNGDRRNIFLVLVKEFQIDRALYPGSYIHIAPSFFIPEVVYVDSYKKTTRFFEDKSILDFINKNKKYDSIPKIRFHLMDYNRSIPEPFEYFDLLISQYAGFISQCCKKYLKPNGLLITNNSHGDASMAINDKSFDFNGVIYYSSGVYRYTTKNLEKYFIPKYKGYKSSLNYVRKTMKGITYTKSASAYIFEKN